VDAYGHAAELLLEARSLLPHVCGVLAMQQCTVAPCDTTQRTALRLARRCATLACISVQSYEKWSPQFARTARPRESAAVWREISDVFDDITYLHTCMDSSDAKTLAAPNVGFEDVRDACALPALRGFADLPDRMFD
jgi:hypothetical protein